MVLGNNTRSIICPEGCWLLLCVVGKAFEAEMTSQWELAHVREDKYAPILASNLVGKLDKRGRDGGVGLPFLTVVWIQGRMHVRSGLRPLYEVPNLGTCGKCHGEDERHEVKAIVKDPEKRETVFDAQFTKPDRTRFVVELKRKLIQHGPGGRHGALPKPLSLLCRST